jgi:hypothetical protein
MNAPMARTRYRIAAPRLVYCAFGHVAWVAVAVVGQTAYGSGWRFVPGVWLTGWVAFTVAWTIVVNAPAAEGWSPVWKRAPLLVVVLTVLAGSGTILLGTGWTPQAAIFAGLGVYVGAVEHRRVKWMPSRGWITARLREEFAGPCLLACDAVDALTRTPTETLAHDLGVRLCTLQIQRQALELAVDDAAGCQRVEDEAKSVQRMLLELWLATNAGPSVTLRRRAEDLTARANAEGEVERLLVP